MKPQARSNFLSPDEKEAAQNDQDKGRKKKGRRNESKRNNASAFKSNHMYEDEESRNMTPLQGPMSSEKFQITMKKYLPKKMLKSKINSEDFNKVVDELDTQKFLLKQSKE